MNVANMGKQSHSLKLLLRYDAKCCSDVLNQLDRSPIITPSLAVMNVVILE